MGLYLSAEEMQEVNVRSLSAKIDFRNQMDNDSTI